MHPLGIEDIMMNLLSKRLLFKVPLYFNLLHKLKPTTSIHSLLVNISHINRDVSLANEQLLQSNWK